MILHPAFEHWVGRPPKRGSAYTHKQKQRAAAEALLGMFLCSDINAMLAAQGHRLDIDYKGNRIADLIVTIDDKMYDERIAHQIKYRGHRKAVLDLVKGNFERVKHACLYMDVENERDARSRPVDRKTADRLIRLASGAISAAVQEFRDCSHMVRQKAA